MNWGAVSVVAPDTKHVTEIDGEGASHDLDEIESPIPEESADPIARRHVKLRPDGLALSNDIVDLNSELAHVDAIVRDMVRHCVRPIGVAEGRWRNPSLSDEAREKLSRPRKYSGLLHQAMEKLTQGASMADLSAEVAGLEADLEKQMHVLIRDFSLEESAATNNSDMPACNLTHTTGR